MRLSTATGRMMLTMLAAIAQFEREMMLEGQQEASRPRRPASTKASAPTACGKADQFQALQAEGVGPSEIARRLGIGRSSVYGCLARSHPIRAGVPRPRRRTP
jgi:DNA invertase Pin-like site-specific DNA recombinase